jgi:Ca2+-transporting ATPase
MILVEQLKNLIVLMLAVAAAIAFGFGQWLEGISIVVAITINGAIGFFTELKAVRSMEALQEMSRVSAKVRRDGRVQEIPAEEVVPGDLVVLEAGDIVSADLRLIEASRLMADESALTGESVPVRKSIDPIQDDVSLADRKNMIFKGTALTGGSGQGVVVATGMDTELGQIASLAEAAEEEETPLEKKLNRLGYWLIWLTMAIAGLVAVTGVIAGEETFLIIETAIALAVAAIPEGLPIVATIALARGMWRLARHNALMNRLSAVETLGATNIICTDKTGTLTENQMTVTKIAMALDESGEIQEIDVKGSDGDRSEFLFNEKPLDPSESGILREALQTGVLCNNASLEQRGSTDKREAIGDPLEVALLALGFKAEIQRDALLESLPEVREEAFDPNLKMMATFHRDDGRFRVAVKGSPESVIEVCSSFRTGSGDHPMESTNRQRWLDVNNHLAGQGLRVLGLATKTVDREDVAPYENLIFLGLLGLLDPPREEVGEAIASCQHAGIRVIMVTGDQPMTAQNIGLTLGLVNTDEAHVVHGKDIQNPDELTEQDRKKLLKTQIFARVTPGQKLDLIALHQKNHAVVAMTGDGVNDAPALKKADIGVAMGQRGTQVAREAADMVLKDDAFKTIVVAIAQGRAIFENIRKFILFLLSGNVSEILIVGIAMLAGAPLPILPLQILYLNMLGDVFPALALGVGRGGPSKMEQPLRASDEAVLTPRHWVAIGGYGFLITGAVLGAFWLALTWLHMPTNHAVTVSFLSLAFARLWHVFNMRDPGSSFSRNDVTLNPLVWGALALCAALLILAVYLPGLSLVLDLTDPGRQGWLLILGASLIPWVVGQVLKTTKTGKHSGRSTTTP